MKELAGDEVTLLGNLPPRDVLAAGSPESVRQGVSEMCADLPDLTRLILSCGGGMPPGVPTENIRAFVEASTEIIGT
jgi:uroporphyrinogen decarboxylase